MDFIESYSKIQHPEESNELTILEMKYCLISEKLRDVNKSNLHSISKEMKDFKNEIQKEIKKIMQISSQQNQKQEIKMELEDIKMKITTLHTLSTYFSDYLNTFSGETKERIDSTRSIFQEKINSERINPEFRKNQKEKNSEDTKEKDKEFQFLVVDAIDLFFSSILISNDFLGDECEEFLKELDSGNLEEIKKEEYSKEIKKKEMKTIEYYPKNRDQNIHKKQFFKTIRISILDKMMNKKINSYGIGSIIRFEVFQKYIVLGLNSGNLLILTKKRYKLVTFFSLKQILEDNTSSKLKCIDIKDEVLLVGYDEGLLIFYDLGNNTLIHSEELEADEKNGIGDIFFTNNPLFGQKKFEIIRFNPFETKKRIEIWRLIQNQFFKTYSLSKIKSQEDKEFLFFEQFKKFKILDLPEENTCFFAISTDNEFFVAKLDYETQFVDLISIVQNHEEDYVNLLKPEKAKPRSFCCFDWVYGKEKKNSKTILSQLMISWGEYTNLATLEKLNPEKQKTKKKSPSSVTYRLVMNQKKIFHELEIIDVLWVNHKIGFFVSVVDQTLGSIDIHFFNKNVYGTISEIDHKDRYKIKGLDLFGAIDHSSKGKFFFGKLRNPLIYNEESFPIIAISKEQEILGINNPVYQFKKFFLLGRKEKMELDINILHKIEKKRPSKIIKKIENQSIEQLISKEEVIEADSIDNSSRSELFSNIVGIILQNYLKVVSSDIYKFRNQIKSEIRDVFEFFISKGKEHIFFTKIIKIINIQVGEDFIFFTYELIKKSREISTLPLEFINNELDNQNRSLQFLKIITKKISQLTDLHPEVVKKLYEFGLSQKRLEISTKIFLEAKRNGIIKTEVISFIDTLMEFKKNAQISKKFEELEVTEKEEALKDQDHRRRIFLSILKNKKYKKLMNSKTVFLFILEHTEKIIVGIGKKYVSERDVRVLMNWFLGLFKDVGTNDYFDKIFFNKIVRMMFRIYANHKKQLDGTLHSPKEIGSPNQSSENTSPLSSISMSLSMNSSFTSIRNNSFSISSSINRRIIGENEQRIRKKLNNLKFEFFLFLFKGYADWEIQRKLAKLQMIIEGRVSIYKLLEFLINQRKDKPSRRYVPNFKTILSDFLKYLKRYEPYLLVSNEYKGSLEKKIMGNTDIKSIFSSYFDEEKEKISKKIMNEIDNPSTPLNYGKSERKKLIDSILEEKNQRIFLHKLKHSLNSRIQNFGISDFKTIGLINFCFDFFNSLILHCEYDIERFSAKGIAFNHDFHETYFKIIKFYFLVQKNKFESTQNSQANVPKKEKKAQEQVVNRDEENEETKSEISSLIQEYLEKINFQIQVEKVIRIFDSFPVVKMFFFSRFNRTKNLAREVIKYFEKLYDDICKGNQFLVDSFIEEVEKSIIRDSGNDRFKISESFKSFYFSIVHDFFRSLKTKTKIFGSPNKEKKTESSDKDFLPILKSFRNLNFNMNQELNDSKRDKSKTDFEFSDFALENVPRNFDVPHDIYLKLRNRKKKHLPLTDPTEKGELQSSIKRNAFTDVLNRVEVKRFEKKFQSIIEDHIAFVSKSDKLTKKTVNKLWFKILKFFLGKLKELREGFIAKKVKLFKDISSVTQEDIHGNNKEIKRIKKKFAEKNKQINNEIKELHEKTILAKKKLNSEDDENIDDETKMKEIEILNERIHRYNEQSTRLFKRLEKNKDLEERILEEQKFKIIDENEPRNMNKLKNLYIQKIFVHFSNLLISKMENFVDIPSILTFLSKFFETSKLKDFREIFNKFILEYELDLVLFKEANNLLFFDRFRNIKSYCDALSNGEFYDLSTTNRCCFHPNCIFKDKSQFCEINKNNDTSLVIFNCSHSFHARCVEKKMECPICGK